MQPPPKRGTIMTIKHSLAIALSLTASLSQAEEYRDHAAQASQHPSAPSIASDHGETQHAVHVHSSMQEPATQAPQRRTGSPVPVLTEADRAAAFPTLPPHRMHQSGTHFLVAVDELEWQDARDGNALAWDMNGWLGGDIDRLAFRSEGERINNHTEHAELQLLWSHAIGPWWESVAGVRQDFKPGAAQTWAALGLQGTPLYGLETEATAFIGERGQTALRLEAEYDILLTQRWVLQPSVEVNLYGRNDARRGIGSGVSDSSVGLRLRYEFSRQFAPHLGMIWNRSYGKTVDLRETDGNAVQDARLVAGIRFWF